MNIKHLLVCALALFSTLTACNEEPGVVMDSSVFSDAGVDGDVTSDADMEDASVRPVNTTFGSVSPPTFPSYVTYSCPPQSSTRENVFCVDANDDYEAIGSTANYDTLLTRVFRAFPRNFRERVVHFDFTPRDTSLGPSSATSIDGTHWEVWLNTNTDLGLDERAQLVEIGKRLFEVSIQDSSVTEPPGTQCGGFSDQIPACPVDDTLFFIWNNFWWDIQLDPAAWAADTDLFYTSQAEMFVNREAANGPLHDITESFGVFINTLRPTGNTASDQKVDAFTYFADYMVVRGHFIREVW